MFFVNWRLISPTSGVNKGCFVAEAHQVGGGVRGIGQSLFRPLARDYS